MTAEQLDALLLTEEDEHLEFKKAEHDFNVEKLRKYCCALANERGGKLVLGVTNRKPRRVVGTEAFRDLEHRRSDLTQVLHLRIDAVEVPHPNGRVVVFDVPSRPIGVPLRYEGVYWMRSGESLTAMTEDMLRRIFDETGPDFSSEVYPEATLDALDQVAIERLRERWNRKSGRADLLGMSAGQLLSDAELLVDGRVTYAALVLMGTHTALGRYLAQAEIVFEYRSSDATGPAQDRKEYRQGFFSFDDELWKTINLRNDSQHFQDGLFIWDIPTFSERVVREALLNAVSHRDYRMAESVFVRQYPRRLEVVSPGGFPSGITRDNILYRQSPRNRRIAEVLAKCGLVERSGQGANVMFETAIRESKPLPDFSGTDDHQVMLTLQGAVQDEGFLRFLERVGAERVRSFQTEDLLVLDLLRRDEAVPANLAPRLAGLREMGLVETTGRARGMKYLLARKLYAAIGDKAGYTRRRGLDRARLKELVLQHLEAFKGQGSPLRELLGALNDPNLSHAQMQKLLRELKAENRVYCRGRTRSGRWFIGPDPDAIKQQSGQQ